MKCICNEVVLKQQTLHSEVRSRRPSHCLQANSNSQEKCKLTTQCLTWCDVCGKFSLTLLVLKNNCSRGGLLSHIKERLTIKHGL